MGFAHLVFAGGRDTVIRLVSGGIAYLAQNPVVVAQLRQDPSMATTLTEELVRYLSPLPYLGRICTRETEIDGLPVVPGQRVALCFADANRDREVFEEADNAAAGRKPNPHVGFGSGPHSCLGSAHARLLSRTVLRAVAERVEGLRLAPGEPAGLDFASLKVRFA